MCKCCRRHDCPDFLHCHPQHLKATVPCEARGRKFCGPTCFANHQRYTIAGEFQPLNSVSKHVRHCRLCGKLNSGLQNIQQHKCGYSICPTCKAYANLHTHRCYIESAREVKRKREEAATRKNAAKRRVGAEPDPTDLEEELMENEDFLPDAPVEEPQPSVYWTDEGDERVIPGEDCVKTFIQDLKEFTEEDTPKVIVIAHNLQAYDGYFVIKELYRDNKTVTQIRSGAKILEISHYDIRFIDSLNFFAFPLSDFPKTFGLKLVKKDEHGRLMRDEEGNYIEDPLAKGYFPHLFNRLENQAYIGPLPPMEDYMPNTMSVEKKKAFEEWYQDQVDQHVVFNFQRDLVDYCKMDVTILRMGCQMFQSLFIKESNFNPFEHVTIASACNRDLIENRLEKEKIASEPTFGWNGKLGNQSKEALQWLQWLNYQKRKNVTQEERDFHAEMKTPHAQHPAYKCYIQHAGNGGEKFIADINTTVDWYEEETNTVYQYHGCYYHGCETCYPNRTESHVRLAGRKMYEVREHTRQTTSKLRRLGYTRCGDRRDVGLRVGEEEKRGSRN